jgi:hypothetical protein
VNIFHFIVASSITVASCVMCLACTERWILSSVWSHRLAAPASFTPRAPQIPALRTVFGFTCAAWEDHHAVRRIPRMGARGPVRGDSALGVIEFHLSSGPQVCALRVYATNCSWSKTFFGPLSGHIRAVCWCSLPAPHLRRL